MVFSRKNLPYTKVNFLWNYIYFGFFVNLFIEDTIHNLLLGQSNVNDPKRYTFYVEIKVILYFYLHIMWYRRQCIRTNFIRNLYISFKQM